MSDDQDTTLADVDMLRAHLHAMEQLAEFTRMKLDQAEADLAAVRAREAVLISTGAELAHWLQVWIDGHPGQSWCYSEGALCDWRQAVERVRRVREETHHDRIPVSDVLRRRQASEVAAHRPRGSRRLEGRQGTDRQVVTDLQ